MRKLTLMMLALVTFIGAQAQSEGNDGQTATGKWLIEANTGFDSVGGTGLQFRSRDGETFYNIGGEVGYFVMDDLAIKGGIAFGGSSVEGSTSIEDAEENPSYLGIQAGYAWFLGDQVSIEPGLRYNSTLNDMADPESNLQLNIGFALYF